MLRVAFAVALLVFFAALEARYPRRDRGHSRGARWPSNIGLQLLNAAIERSLPWLAPLAISEYASSHQIGLLHGFALTQTVTMLVSLLMLDLTIYWQHRLFHRVPLLWRVHRMHHTDRDLDVTSGLRFHPIEILLSLIIKSSAVLLLGISVDAILLFALLLNGTSLFNHANLALPEWIDRYLRLVLVTPDMHRIHHSIDESEHDSNFGFNLSCWDRLFRSYCAEPKLGQQHMVLGLSRFNRQPTGSLLWMLKQPFQG